VNVFAKTAVVEGLFLGAAAGNIWSMPFIGHNIIALTIVMAFIIGPAFVGYPWTHGRGLFVAALAGPVAYYWQKFHQADPDTSVAMMQFAALLVGTQAAALVARERQP
jgi:hypothetical protein